MMILKEFSRIVCVSLFSYQGSLFAILRQLVYFTTFISECQALFLKFFNFFSEVVNFKTEKEGFEPSRRLPDLYP